MDVDSTTGAATFSQPDPDAIAAERVALLYRQVTPTLPLALIVAAICVWVFWKVGNRTGLSAWFAATAAVVLLRYLLVRWYRAAARTVASASLWESRFVAGAAAMGCAWAALVLLVDRGRSRSTPSSPC